jgi:transposase
MKKTPASINTVNDYRDLTVEELLAVIAEKDREVVESAEKLKIANAQLNNTNDQLNNANDQLRNSKGQLSDSDELLQLSQRELKDSKKQVSDKIRYIRILEEYLRLVAAQKFGASSEKNAYQVSLFDEVELETALNDLEDLLPEEDLAKPRPPKTRQRNFSSDLNRIRIELALLDEEKAGALRTFFTKVKEELEYVPAKLNVLEYWQEKAVFATDDGSDKIVAAQRPTHPLGKCYASVSLLAYILVAKYADGLPLYRLEGILKRSGADLNRSSMAQWIIRLSETFKPLINHLRDIQNSSNYLQADETRLQVLKEPGKTAQSDKWMWVIRGGPPNQPSVLFNYDPSRAGSVPERLLEGFQGVLQADGYSGYGKVCASEHVTRIGCMDHARRKFIEATKAVEPAKGKKRRGSVSKADVALSQIRKLYRIEAGVKDKTDAQRFTARQELAVPILNDLKIWLDANLGKVLKGGLTHKAIQYMINQWPHLIGYCNDGKLQISNALAENAIRPFAVGRRAWLFADTPQGAHASASCYSLIETAKANDIEPQAYIKYLLERITEADTHEKLDALMPWNVPLEKIQKK